MIWKKYSNYNHLKIPRKYYRKGNKGHFKDGFKYNLVTLCLIFLTARLRWTLNQLGLTQIDFANIILSNKNSKYVY